MKHEDHSHDHSNCGHAHHHTSPADEARRALVLEALRNVRLPAQRANILDAEQLVGIDLQEKSLLVVIRLPQQNETFERSLRYQVEKSVKEKISDLSVDVQFEFGSEPSAKKAEPSGSIPKIGTMIAVGSGKGGVGKSTVTVNLAYALKKMNYKVGILDCDLYGPSVPTLLGVEGMKPLVVDGKIQPIDSNGIQVMSAGFFIEEGQGLIWRGPMIHKLIQQFYKDVQWDGTDVLLVDLPPGTGDAPLSLSQTMPLNGAIMVSLPQKLSLIDVKKAVSMFAQVKVPLLGLVENMAEFICPHCEGQSEIFSRGGVKKFCQEQGIPYFGDLPLDPRLRELSDRGENILREYPDSPVSKAFMKLAERLVPLIRSADEAEAPMRVMI